MKCSEGSGNMPQPSLFTHTMNRLMTKPSNDLCTQRRLRSAWASAQSDQSSLCAQWVAKDPSFLHADREDSNQTGRMPRLNWVFAGRTCILMVLSWGGSYLHLEEFLDKEPHLWPSWVAVHMHLSLVTRKPVFGVCDQVRLKPACLATKTS